MAFVKAAALSAVPPGTVTGMEIGGKRYAICNVDGTVHALDAVCPHRGGPLGEGAINGANLVCPWHAWEFHCASGENDYNPSIRLARFPVEVRGLDIFLDVS
jgi:nitrite reductase/ring-hydroxylating ferredoxin subunit